ncbi:hypothetical protein A4X09_0g7176 [Tilletia walkeri]|uniref:Uncharacterized protein n=1 Tax=Tilletia walkeri TaxID=117179 RepID=A0A8X7N2E2_9BASI|nr:hypothetical protein A4X09_0g7176 [Tilletia walkeri]
MFASQHRQQQRRRTAAGVGAGVLIIFTTLISSAQAQAADDDSGSSSSSSTTGYTDPDADPALLNDGNISVTTPAQALIACDDTPTLRWAWSGDDTAAYYHRVDIYTFSTTLASALDPTALEASVAAGTPLPTGLTLISPTRGIRLSDEEYRWRPVNVPADSYTIYVIVRDRPTKFGQSGIFTVDTGDDTSCILAPGVIAPNATPTTTSSRPTIRPTSTTRNSTTARPTNTTSGSNAGSSGSSSNSGTIAAAVAVPIIVILAAIAAFIFYRRKKRSKLANSNNRYANVSSNGGSGSGGGGGGLEKQEEMLPIAHSHAQRTFDSPSPVEQRGSGGWASKFAGGRNKNAVGAGAAAAGTAAAVGTGAALLANQRRSDEEEKYTDKPAAPATHEVAVEEPELFNDYQVAAAAAAAAGGAEEGSSPTSEGEPGGRRPVIPALSGWYLDREAQKEVPSLPPTADEMVHTDGEEEEAADDDEEAEEEAQQQHHQAEVDDLNRRLSQLPPGSTAAAIAAAAAASRTLPSTPAPASPAFGNAQLPAPQALFGSSGPRSRPPSAYNNPGMGMASLGMGGPASASTSTSSLKNAAAAGGASPPSGGENHVRPTSRAHRRTNSGFAGVGALYAGESGVPATGGNNLTPPAPSAALMAGPSSRSSSSIPALGTFPVGVSFSPGQIVSFGGGAGNGPRSMAGVGAGRVSGGIGAASSPPSAFSPNATGAQSGQPARPPTPTRMMPSGSGGAGGGSGFVPPVGTLAGRYPSWYGGNAAGDDVQQSPPSRPGSSSGASSPRIGTMSPFGDQHRTRT